MECFLLVTPSNASFYQGPAEHVKFAVIVGQTFDGEDDYDGYDLNKPRVLPGDDSETCRTNDIDLNDNDSKISPAYDLKQPVGVADLSPVGKPLVSAPKKDYPFAGNDNLPASGSRNLKSSQLSTSSEVVKCVEIVELNSSLTEDDFKEIYLSPDINRNCLLYTSPSPRDGLLSRMPSSA